MASDLLPKLREEMKVKLKGGLYHQTQIKLTFNTNRIEGSRLSEEQTRYIFETNTVNAPPDESVNVDDVVETINHFAAFDAMLTQADAELTAAMIKDFHRLLKRNTSQERLAWFRVGDYKEQPNMVGDTQTTAPDRVPGEMDRLLADYHSGGKTFEDIVEFHVRFERIHPFQDGNGRVGRLILFKECLANGHMPFIIDHRHKLFYYRGLKEYDTEKGYLLDTCRSAQDAYEQLAAYFYPENQTEPDDELD